MSKKLKWTRINDSRGWTTYESGPWEIVVIHNKARVSVCLHMVRQNISLASAKAFCQRVTDAIKGAK